MISKLHIENFQSHENTMLDFCDGVNVIEGVSQSGKTAILRALQWLINNRPRGFRFHSSFAGKNSTGVSVKLKSFPQLITLKKQNNDAVYSIGSEKFKGFASNVPDKIKEVLNFTELNIQNQLDEPFLITSSHGEIARTINQITKLEKVDFWVKSLTSKINRINHERELISDQIKTWKDQFKKYNNLDLVKINIDRLSNIELFIEESKDLFDSITYLVNEIIYIDRKIADFPDISGLDDQIDIVKKLSDEIIEEQTLISLLSDGAVISNSIEICDLLIVDLQEAISLWAEFQEYFDFKQEFFELDDIEQNLSEVLQVVDNYKTEYINVFQDLGKCPLCLSNISSDMIDQLVEDI